MTNGNETAYPITQSRNTWNGLTKREYFAAMALASGSTPKDAVSKADELIKLLNNESR